jgi:murein DD-endopeptidase MepM/ murein hydrolase activator NlpD
VNKKLYLHKNFFKPIFINLFLILTLLSACSPVIHNDFVITQQVPVQDSENNLEIIQPTLLPTRPPYPPGTIVDYIAQSGDTLPAVAAHFNTTIEEIKSANPVIPNDVTTLPPGFPMQIPIYYQSIWSSPFQIIPDAAFVYGPNDVGFDVIQFVNDQPGWLKTSRDAVGERMRSGAEVVLYISEMFSISPRLFLSILEYQTGALSQPELPENVNGYLLGYRDFSHRGFAQQLIWLANHLNNGYYNWRNGTFSSYNHSDGRLELPDPWQNAGSVALQYYFSQVMDREQYTLAVSGQGLLKTYQELFGDPWEGDTTIMAGSLQQPDFILPFNPGQIWAYTGGPHTAWGQGQPFSAVDFAPGSNVGGCSPTTDYALAVADGVVVRTGTAFTVLDLDGDGDERTGWNIFYLHLANASIRPVGTVLKRGDPIGLPSCEGGTSTGTHVHIARKYNGEWVLAGGALAFNFEGWKVASGSEAYQGSLVKDGRIIRACVCSDESSQLIAQWLP